MYPLHHFVDRVDTNPAQSTASLSSQATPPEPPSACSPSITVTTGPTRAPPRRRPRQRLEAIESAMIVVCLDDTKPVTRERKDAIKSKGFGASPDAWAQLIKQLAFHRMCGRPGVTYGSAQTRKYQLDRTEVIRSASSESKAWAEVMGDAERAAVAPHLKYAACGGRAGRGPASVWAAEDAEGGGERAGALPRPGLSSPCLDGWGYGEVVWAVVCDSGAVYPVDDYEHARGRGDVAAVAQKAEKAEKDKAKL
ncbi:Choline/Carnitine o-acyltransferase-domain-containing protein [Mycena galericulata]|nr:Choline/Carnitine o-acyltransferase-domain-containing protein [Mycena galericulata]